MIPPELLTTTFTTKRERESVCAGKILKFRKKILCWPFSSCSAAAPVLRCCCSIVNVKIVSIVDSAMIPVGIPTLYSTVP